MSDLENRPWAFDENEKKRKKKSLESIESKEDAERFFEVQKMRISQNIARYNLLSLKKKIETGGSLSELKNAISDARASGEISDADFREVQKLMETMDTDDADRIFVPPENNYILNISKLPGGENEFIKKLENSKLGENIVYDVISIAYGFFVQGGFILSYIALRLIFDAIALPKDIYTLIRSR
jgi:hypothetical protein